MDSTRKIWIFFIVLWVYIWMVLALEMMFPEPGITLSTLFYVFTAPPLVLAGLYWINKTRK